MELLWRSPASCRSIKLNFWIVFQYKDAFMKANPGYRWCPTTSKPVKSSPCQPVNNASKKVWPYPSSSGVAKDSTTAKRVPKAESIPQFNFAMAGELTARWSWSARRLPRLLWSRLFLFVQILQRWAALACCC